MVNNMEDIKISELSETTELDGLYTIGTDKNNLSKKVSLQFLKDAANYANAQGDYAKETAEGINGNIGANDFPVFSESKSYKANDIVRYYNRLYRFRANHIGEWNGNDAVLTSIHEILNDKVSDLEEDVIQLKIKVDSGAGGGSGEGGAGMIIVDNAEYLDMLAVPKGTVASVVTETENETEKPLSELYDFIAEGGNPQGEVDYDILPRMTDVAITFPNTTWSDGRILIGREGGVASSRYYLVVDSTRVRFAYGQGEILLLAENNGETILRYDDAVAQMHDILRGVDGLRYMGISAGSIEDLSQFFAIIQREVIADAYILGENWQRLMKDGEMPEIDLSALATKEEVIENEEITAAALNDLDKRVKASATTESVASILLSLQDYSKKTDVAESIAALSNEVNATIESLTNNVIENEEVTATALNDLNDKKASKEDVANAIAEAITNTLNTAV